MRLNIQYKSEYIYDAPVHYALQRLRQTPRTRPGQTIINWRTELEGADLQVTYSDHLDNTTDLISVTPGTSKIGIVTQGEVDTEDLAGVVGRHTGFAPLWLFTRATKLTASNGALLALGRAVPPGDEVSRMHALMALIAEQVTYGTGATHTQTTAAEALAAGQGVCQDHTHIFISVARSLGLPARYVSGFLMMDGHTEQAASHAWAEIHIPNLGWVGFDASNGVCADARYVGVATGLDFTDAAPISGIRHGNATETLAVSLIVEQ